MKAKTPTWDDVLNLTLAKMRDEAIKMVDDAIDIMEPLQREDFECAANYDKLLRMREKAEKMPSNLDEAIAAHITVQ